MQLKENNKLKLISFLIAILLFLSVNENFKNFSVLGDSSSDNATAWVSDVPLDVDYDRDKLYVVGIPNTVSVKLSGTKTKVQKESVAKNFKAKLNLRNAQIGDDQKVRIEIDGLEKGVDGTAEPSVITISIREKATKEFKVTPVVKKERLLIGYEVDNLSVSNETVKISGAIESLNRINEVRAESDTRTKLNRNTREEAKLVAYDSDYNKIEDIQIEPSSTVMNIELKNIEKEVNSKLLNETKENLEKKKQQLQRLHDSISSGVNKLNSDDPVSYVDEYNNYIQSINTLQTENNVQANSALRGKNDTSAVDNLEVEKEVLVEKINKII